MDSSLSCTKINETSVEALRVPSFNTIKTDEYSRVFINWNYKFDQVDIGDIVPDLIGKIVIVGVTAAGLSNPVPSPTGSQHPHMVQANILQTLLNGDSVSIPNWIVYVEYFSLFVLVLLIVVLSRVKFSIVWIALLLFAYIYL